MSLIQNIFQAILPSKWFDKIKNESMQWQYVCVCGYEKSLWDAGGLRFSASPSTKPVAGKCPACGQTGKMCLVKK